MLENFEIKIKTAVAIPRASDFNSVITLDLKEIGNVNVLWMVCAFTRIMKGVVLKEKRAETVIRSLLGRWCMNYGFPAVGFYADNRVEF